MCKIDDGNPWGPSRTLLILSLNILHTSLRMKGAMGIAEMQAKANVHKVEPKVCTTLSDLLVLSSFLTILLSILSEMVEKGRVLGHTLHAHTFLCR